MEKKKDYSNKDGKKVMDGLLDGFSPVSTPRIFWKSRRRSASGRSLDKVTDDTANETPNKQEEFSNDEKMQEANALTELSELRKALFEPLEPGWLIGKKRKLVNVDVVESMRRIAVQEMNRKDREINGLNEQLEGDARCLEHLQLQLLQERSKRAEVERENTMLQEQISMLMNMLEENEQMGDEGARDEDPDEP
ncbi:hypothetical protein P3X46_033881 [Hevea brasiliensis]|uniref:Uncharacterized protein n=1 Tax=Hevea brasiliensis TaxID=3981 RepID=A0ABQ9KA48_HEVBR|nr:hypothetical protein P3X46_033881 [Hevea brasiliensis]